jgi:phosphopantetheine adenylyltransferase
MKTSKKQIIIRLLRQVYDYADEIIHLKDKIKELETDLEKEKEYDQYN